MENKNPHTFTEEEESKALDILDSIKTCREAAGIMLSEMNGSDAGRLAEMAELLGKLLAAVGKAAEPYAKKQTNITLPQTSRSMLESLQDICRCWPERTERSRMKLQFELIPTLEEMYMRFYYWAYVDSHPNREQRYYSEEIYELASNPYANEALETKRFKYDVSFTVLAYNHLDYTKKCVESLLKNIPRGLNCELILWDNGSSDGTAEYFESIQPTKLIESRSNWSIGSAPSRAIEGRYHFGISNDVVILPGAIENMLDCMRADESIAWVVPSTPNVSNYQTIPCKYNSEEELLAFARKNNVGSVFRREQRTRLCDPIGLQDTLSFYSRKGVCHIGYLNKDVNMFPDDRVALLFRRSGRKMFLSKDAYCHHFGSVTLKDEITKKNEQTFYNEGRRKFLDWFGIDPWGTGFCYAPIFLERVVGEHSGHVEVLGINCGMGSNSLKIKEQIKEYCHNTDCTLTNITDDGRLILDLKGVSDAAEMVTKIKELKSLLFQRSFDYIVWETPFLPQYKFGTLLDLCAEHLAEGGMLLIKRSEQNSRVLNGAETGMHELGDDWFVRRKTC